MLRSVPGVGPIVALTLLADLPELGRLSHAQIAALVGVAPVNRESGTWRGRRTIWGGRAAVRAALYMGTLRATCCNPLIRPFYQRLLAKGKAKKVALVACMHKLLTILNAMVRHQTVLASSGRLSLPGRSTHRHSCSSVISGKDRYVRLVQVSLLPELNASACFVVRSTAKSEFFRLRSHNDKSGSYQVRLGCCHWMVSDVP